MYLSAGIAMVVAGIVFALSGHPVIGVLPFFIGLAISWHAFYLATRTTK